METNPRHRLQLGGQWELAFDPQDVGVGAGWPAGRWPSGAADTVDVPALWQVTHPDKVGVGFYRRTFAIPAAWHGQVVRLCVGGASYRLDAWLNGVYVGSHEGAYTPFWLDVTSAARAGGANELVLRVASLSKSEAVDGLMLQHCPASKQSWYYIEAGLWGEVYLEALPTLWCEAVRLEPDLVGRRVLAEVEIHNHLAGHRPAELRLVVTDPAGRIVTDIPSPVAALPGVITPRYVIPLSHAVSWSCDNPALYHLQATLRADGMELDTLTTRFGMRDVTVENGHFLLNGQAVYLRGVLLQPNYPVTLICPPDPAMMRQEISLAKEAGFNLIRTHLRPSPPGFLDLCDELGMMVYAESSLGWIRDNPRLLEHGRRELAAMIRRDYNHPSVVVWGILNENPRANALCGETLQQYVRSLDPTRVILDHSGGSMAIDQDFGWVDRATVLPNRSAQRQKLIDVHIYVGAPIPHGIYEYLRTLGTDRPPINLPDFGFASPEIVAEFNRELRDYTGKVFVSELGCGGMSDLDDTVARFGKRDLVDAREMRAFRDGLHAGFAARRLERVFGSVQNLIAATQEAQAAGNARQVEALLANPRVSGYIMTQLNDMAWEFHAGLLDLWRNPKAVFHTMQRLNRPHCLILKASSPVVAVGERVPVTVTVVNDQPAPDGSMLLVTTCDGEGQPLGSLSMAVPLGAGIVEVGTVEVDTSRGAGRFRVCARLAAGDGRPLAESTEVVLALPAVDPSEAVGRVSWLGEPPSGAPTETKARDGLLGVARPASLAEEHWRALLQAVEAGGVAIVGPLQPGDHMALAALAAHGLQPKLHMAIGSWMGCYHWVAASPLFEGLPAGGLAGEFYGDVLPRYALSEQGGEILAGSLRNTQTRLEPPAILWYSDVEAVRLGKGTLLLCQYRLFDQARANPLAMRMLRNLIAVAASYRHDSAHRL